MTTTLSILLAGCFLVVGIGVAIVAQRRQHGHVASFVLTCLATFIGVFAAVILSDFSNYEQGHAKMISTLVAAQAEIRLCVASVSKVRSQFDSTKDEEFTYSDSTRSDPIPSPSLIGNVGSSDAITQYLSAEGLIRLMATANTLRDEAHALNSVRMSNRLMKANTLAYLTNLEFAKNVLALERNYQEGGVSEAVYKQAYDKLLKLERKSIARDGTFHSIPDEVIETEDGTRIIIPGEIDWNEFLRLHDSALDEPTPEATLRIK